MIHCIVKAREQQGWSSIGVRARCLDCMANIRPAIDSAQDQRPLTSSDVKEEPPYPTVEHDETWTKNGGTVQ